MSNNRNNRKRRKPQAVYRLWRIEMREVMIRDGNCCLCCGALDNLTIDHIIPLSKGGLDHPTNMQTLCQPCNLAKGQQTIDYRKKGRSNG